MVTAALDPIQRAAIQRLGVVDAIIHRYEVRRPVGRIASEMDVLDVGVWFMLYGKRTAESGWEAIGRRRTRGELLGMIENRSCCK